MWQSPFTWTLISLAISSADLIHTQEQAKHTEQCGQVSLERCSPYNRCSISNKSVTCCHLNDFQLKESLSGFKVNFTSVYVYNLTSSDLGMPSVLMNPELEILAITDGNVKKISGKFGFGNKFDINIKCLNLSGNGLTKMEKNALILLSKLHILDLSRNNLTNLPILSAQQDLELDISGNSRMGCPDIQELMKQMKNKTLDFYNKNTTVCLLPGSFHWFNSTDNVTLHILEDLNERETQCVRYPGLQKCVCKAHRIVYAGDPTLAISVDCSNLQLEALPSQLPENTISLDVSFNNISNVDAMSIEDTYKKIRIFTADHNLISSITVLENTEFINNFSMLSLRYNNLKTVPTYFLSNSFDRNGGSIRLHLGGNKLFCDCNTAQVLKVWLVANKKNVPDYKEVLCKNYPKKVVDLNQQQVCLSKKEWTDYIYYIIAGEVTLLIFLVSKVSYDYWVFKTAGYLPWPASKMPKLPCDWVFET